VIVDARPLSVWRLLSQTGNPTIFLRQGKEGRARWMDGKMYGEK
jgi:hypothetical protein